MKVPQIGWNPVRWRRAQRRSTRGCPTRAPSTTRTRSRRGPRDPEDVLGTADYGSEFVSVVERPPVYGLQSHPEKSGPDGLRLLGNFVRAARVAA